MNGCTCGLEKRFTWPWHAADCPIRVNRAELRTSEHSRVAAFLALLAWFFVSGAALWYCAHHLAWWTYAGLYVLGQALHTLLFHRRS